MSEEEDEVQGNTEVAGDEGLVVELNAGGLDEDVEVLSQGDEAAEEQSDVGSPDAEGCLVREGVGGNVLRTTCPDEVDVRDEQGDPGEDTEDGGEVDEVDEDLAGVI